MNNIYNDNIVLHECVIDSVLICDSKLILNCNNGVYIRDESSNSMKKLQNCSINIKINNLSVGLEYEHIDICLFNKRKKKVVDFKMFSKLVKERKFKIYIDFYSIFANAMLIKGTIYPYEIEMMISEIVDITLQTQK